MGAHRTQRGVNLQTYPLEKEHIGPFVVMGAFMLETLEKSCFLDSVQSAEVPDKLMQYEFFFFTTVRLNLLFI